MLEGRSSIGRLGMFIHVTAGFGDVGFSGFWTLEIFVIQPLIIYPNVDICQIYYHTIEGDYDLYNSGKYQGNKGIQGSLLYKDFISVKQGVIDYIQRVGVTIVFCDGGWKKGELNLLSNFIKPGDFILAHDYCDNKQVFEEKIKGKVWNWFEISFNDIKESCERNGLIEYDKEIFNNVAWTCRQKL